MESLRGAAELRDDTHHLCTFYGAREATVALRREASDIPALDHAHFADKVAQDERVGGKLEGIDIKLVEHVLRASLVARRWHGCEARPVGVAWSRSPLLVGKVAGGYELQAGGQYVVRE